MDLGWTQSGVLESVISAGAAAMGLMAVIRNRWFAEASVESSKRYFGITLREGTRAYRFNWIFSRTLSIVVGLGMFIAGSLGLLGIDWRDVYR